MTAAFGAVVMALLGVQAPAAQAAAPGDPAPATAKAAAADSAGKSGGESAQRKAAAAFGGHPNAEPLCAAPDPGSLACFALRRTDLPSSSRLRSAAEEPAGLAPADLRAAYGLPADGGAGRTVAIIDAYDSPTAEEDLAVYRAEYGLPACTTANGCFTKVDQRGGTTYPEADAGWAGEIALDLDMVSAAAPGARILLVEADDSTITNLGAAVDEAVALGAKYISNSYGTQYDFYPEDPAESQWDTHYDHPGVAIVASSGDNGYGVAFPAASPHVTAVGGTSLAPDTASARGWRESVWSGAGSGCSQYVSKPVFQHDDGCAMRSVADVAAVADPQTGVAVYDSYGSGGWAVLGGTSASSPIIAGVYAAAGAVAPGSHPNVYPYAADGGLNDVVTGTNGDCDPAYLCSGAKGYDGPTGLGTPAGLSAFRIGANGQITGTVTAAGTRKPIAGVSVTAGLEQVHTDAQGRYTLTVPTGRYDLRVDGYGYTIATVKGLRVRSQGTTTKDVALDQAALRPVTGVVGDGSGHHWPLYAKITVDGMPGGPHWTDPITGQYTLNLPAGHQYMVHIAAVYSGYRPVTRAVSVAGQAVTADIPVPADDQAADTLGYAVTLHGPLEEFTAGTSAPAGWTVTNAPGTTGGWTFDDPGGRGNHTGGEGAFAIVDSDNLGSGARQDSTLVSPVYDLGSATHPVLDFATDYQSYSGQEAIIDASSDGGATWTLLRDVTDPAPGPVQAEVPLTGFAGRSAVQVRFRFVGEWGEWWALDDVRVGDRTYDAVPGGLVAGLATDANTHKAPYAVDVTVGAGTAARSTTTSATPDDPALGDGFYWQFAASGANRVTAAKPGYTDLATTVLVSQDRVNRADLALKAGRISVGPAALTADVAWKGHATKTFTVRNTGTADASVTITDQVPAIGEPTAPGVPADEWRPAADLPSAVMDNSVDAYQGKVYSGFGVRSDYYTAELFRYDPAADAWTTLAQAADARHAVAHGFIGGRLYAAGGWLEDGTPDPKLEIYDPAQNSWSTGAPEPRPRAAVGSAVTGGKLYSIGGCVGRCGNAQVDVYDAATNTWTQAADYPVAVSFPTCGAIGGKIYCAGGAGTDGAPIANAYVLDPATNTWTPAPSMPYTVWGASSTVADGRLLISGGADADGTVISRSYAFDPQSGSWTRLPDTGTAVYRGGAAVGMYKVGGSTGHGGDYAITGVEKLSGWDQSDMPDVDWLSTRTHQLTLRPGQSATVTVLLDAGAASVTRPGDLTAELVLRDGTPYAGHTVPVRMRVAEEDTGR